MPVTLVETTTPPQPIKRTFDVFNMYGTKIGIIIHTYYGYNYYPNNSTGGIGIQHLTDILIKIKELNREINYVG